MDNADQDFPRPPQGVLGNAQVLRQDLISQLNRAKSTLELADLYSVHRLLDESSLLLRQLINRSQPINRLPPEVLCNIFSLVPNDIPQVRIVARVHPTFMKDVAQYYPLLLTCRYWYELLSGTPSFWSTITDQLASNGLDTLYKNYLARCPTGPLCIFVPEGASDALLDDCRSTEFRERVQQLSFACRLLDHPENCGGLLYYSFPALYTCVLLRYFCPDTGRDSIQARRILPDSQRLRYLWIRNTNVIPASPFPALEEFYLGSAYLDQRFEALLCAFLSNCPCLQILELDTFIVRETTDLSRFDPLPPVRDKVMLGSLQTLILSQDFFDHVDDSMLTPVGRLMEWFGDHVIVPPRCNFRIKLAHYEDLASFHSLFNVTHAMSTATLTCELQTWQGGRSRRLSLEAWTIDKIHLAFDVRGYMIRAPYELEGDEAREEYLARAVANELRDGRARFNSSLTSSPVFNALQRLRIGADASWALLRPCSILLALHHLRLLAIADSIRGYEHHFPHTIADVLDTLVSALDPGLPCPVLQSLIIDCSHTLADAREISENDQPEHLSQKIREVAASRALLGHPLGRLFYLFEAGRNGGGATADERRALCLHEYDGSATLVRTAHGKDGRVIVDREWERH